MRNLSSEKVSLFYFKSTSKQNKKGDRRFLRLTAPLNLLSSEKSISKGQE